MKFDTFSYKGKTYLFSMPIKQIQALTGVKHENSIRLVRDKALDEIFDRKEFAISTPKDIWIIKVSEATGLSHRELDRIWKALDEERRVWTSMDWSLKDEEIATQYGYALTKIKKKRKRLDKKVNIRKRMQRMDNYYGLHLDDTISNILEKQAKETHRSVVEIIRLTLANHVWETAQGCDSDMISDDYKPLLYKNKEIYKKLFCSKE